MVQDYLLLCNCTGGRCLRSYWHGGAPLKRIPLESASKGDVVDINFDEPFLSEFHQKVTGLCTEAGVVISNVEKQQWCLRYTFHRADEVATYDVWYNDKDRITKCAPLKTACSPGTLVSEVGLLLT